MKTCINGATTMPYPLEKDIEAAGEAGFQGIEIWRDKLDTFLGTRRKEDLKDLLSAYSLKVAAFCPFGGYVWCSEEDFEKKLRATVRYLEVANYVGCETLIVCAEGVEGKSASEMIEAHADRLAKLADVCKDYEVRVAMEWFWNLKDGFKVIEKADHDYLGIVIDTFHWYRGDGDIGSIRSTPRGKLYMVHISDCENLPREALTDRNRLYCGLGVIPLVEILRELKSLGYGGYLSVEVFREEYWKKDPLAISREALEALRNIMGKASVL